MHTTVLTEKLQLDKTYISETKTNDKNDIRFDSGFQNLDSDSIRLFFNYFLYVRFDSVFFSTIIHFIFKFFYALFINSDEKFIGVTLPCDLPADKSNQRF